MALLTGLALTLVSFAPQGDGSNGLSVLSNAATKSLNGKAKDWFEAWYDRLMAPDSAARRRLQRKFQGSKDAFIRDWESRERGAKVDDLLKYVDDLEVIFDKAFPYKRQTTSGQIKTIKPRDAEVPPYDIVAPRNYRDRESYRTIVVMPGFVNGSWESGEDHYDATWKGSKLASETIFFLPALDDAMDLDPAPNWSRPDVFETVQARNAALFLPLRDLQSTFRMDRRRVFLDCGQESSGWGLRFASYFPQRFAGLILRNPVDTGDLRLDSLTGLPVLLVRSAATAAACEEIEQTLNGFEAGSCTVIDAQDAYPHPGSQAEIATWVEGLQRNLFRNRVVLAPNNDLYNDGYWVKILDAEPVDLLTAAEKPRLIVEANRETNRIEVQATSVNEFQLLLNDALVNLDQEFTVVINGKAMTQRRGRSLNIMTEGIMDAGDPSWIFTARFQASVPKKDDGAPKEAEAPQQDDGAPKRGKELQKDGADGR